MQLELLVPFTAAHRVLDLVLLVLMQYSELLEEKLNNKFLKRMLLQELNKSTRVLDNHTLMELVTPPSSEVLMVKKELVKDQHLMAPLFILHHTDQKQIQSTELEETFHLLTTS